MRNTIGTVRALVALVSGVLATAGLAHAATVVVARSGEPSPAGLISSTFVGAATGDADEVALLVQTSGVFRAVPRDGQVVAERLFAPGDLVEGQMIIGAGPPAVAPNGCVVARLALADGGEGIYRRCGDTLERLAGVDDAVGLRSITSLDAAVVTSGGGYVAFLARLSDGHVAVVRGGLGPLTEIARTGGSSPAGGTISSLRTIGVRVSGTVGFGATVVDGRDGLFEGDGTAIRKVLVEGDGSLNGTIDAIEGAAMNGAGVFAFLGELDDAAGTRGIFRADARPPLPQVALAVKVGDVAPGVSGGTFARFPPSLVPGINAVGDLVFRVTLGGDATGAGVFVAAANGGVRKIVTTREELAVGTLTRLRDPGIADDGSVVVVATPPSAGVGLYVARDDEVSALITYGAAADIGSTSQLFRFVLPSVASDAAGAVFLGQHDALVAIDAAGTARVVAQLGAETSVRGVFSEIDVPAVGSEGRVAFRGEIAGGKTGQAIFVDRGDGRPVAVARAGRPAPGPGRFRDFPTAATDGGVSVDVAGSRIGFLASLFDSRAFEGIFLRRGRSDGRSLARVNKRAPGGGKYVSIDAPTILDTKHYAFSALVRDDATRQALYWRDGRQTRIVARQGLETGSRLGGRFQVFSSPDLSTGGLVFRADVSPVGQDGLFLALDTRRGLLLASGDPTDGAEAIRSIDRPVWAGASVVFSGALVGVPSLRGLFRVTPGDLPGPEDPPHAVTTLLREGWSAPGGGTVVDVRSPAANPRGTLATIVRVEGGPSQQVVVKIDADSSTSP